MKINPERKEIISKIIKIKNKKEIGIICDTSYKNLMNLISAVTRTKTINDLTEEQAKALELLLVLL